MFLVAILLDPITLDSDRDGLGRKSETDDHTDLPETDDRTDKPETDDPTDKPVSKTDQRTKADDRKLSPRLFVATLKQLFTTPAQVDLSDMEKIVIPF
jgi:hypothetical protein